MFDHLSFSKLSFMNVCFINDTTQEQYNFGLALEDIYKKISNGETHSKLPAKPLDLIALPGHQ